MLLPDNIHPENTIYYQGAQVLKVLQENGNLGLGELYQMTQQQQEMSFAVFLLCLDWLFLADIIDYQGEEVYLCS